MPTLRERCLALVQALNWESAWGLAPQQLQAVVEATLPHIQDVVPSTTGVLTVRDQEHLRDWLELGRRCYNAAQETCQQQEWGLDEAGLTSLASAVLPHARAALRSQAASSATLLREIVANYYADCGLVAQLEGLAAPGSGDSQPPSGWQSFLQEVAAAQGLSPAASAALAMSVWPCLLRGVRHFHYASRLRTWIYHVVHNYALDGETVSQLGWLSLPVLESLVDAYLPPDDPPSGRQAARLSALGSQAGPDRAGLPPEAVALVRYLADSACRLLAEDPPRLARRACADLLAGLDGFYFGSRLKTWAFSILLNSRKQVLKEMAREPVPLPGGGEDAEWEPASGGTEPFEAAAGGDLSRLLLEQIQAACRRMHDRSEPRRREGRQEEPVSRATKEWIGRLRFLEGEEIQEIAAMTGVKANTVMTVVDRIKRCLLEAPWLAEYAPLLRLAVERLGASGEALAAGQPLRQGEGLRCRVRLDNAGQVEAGHAALTIRLDEGVTCVDGSLGTSPRLPPAAVDPGGRAVHWQGGLRPGQAVEICLELTAVPGFPAGAMRVRAEARLGRLRAAVAELAAPLVAE